MKFHNVQFTLSQMIWEKINIRLYCIKLPFLYVKTVGNSPYMAQPDKWGQGGMSTNIVKC